MQVQLKSIRDFVGDVRPRPRYDKDDEFGHRKGDPVPPPLYYDQDDVEHGHIGGDPIPPQFYPPNLTIHPRITRERMWGKGANQPLEVSVYSIAPGEEDELHFHPDHIELVICWRGRGTVTIARTKAVEGNNIPEQVGDAFQIKIRPGDSLVVPKGAFHRFVADSAQPMLLPNPANPPVPIDDSLNWPAEKLELIVIHAHGCVRVPGVDPVTLKEITLQDIKPLDRTDEKEKDNDLYSLLRPIGKFCGYARDVRLQCVRARIWGREAERNTAGDADDAKPTLHCTAYTFIPGQENPEHYHPHSVEFVMRKSTHAREPMELSALLITIDSSKLSEPDGKILVKWRN